MNTMTGDFLTEVDRYGDEVLNANWLPQMLLAALGLQPPERVLAPARAQTQTDSEKDPEGFMQRLYRAQE